MKLVKVVVQRGWRTELKLPGCYVCGEMLNCIPTCGENLILPKPKRKASCNSRGNRFMFKIRRLKLFKVVHVSMLSIYQTASAYGSHAVYLHTPTLGLYLFVKTLSLSAQFQISVSARPHELSWQSSDCVFVCSRAGHG